MVVRFEAGLGLLQKELLLICWETGREGRGCQGLREKPKLLGDDRSFRMTQALVSRCSRSVGLGLVLYKNTERGLEVL